MTTKLKSKLERPENPHARTLLRQTKVNASEAAAIQRAANHYCNGNVSEYLRRAAILYAKGTKGRK